MSQTLDQNDSPRIYSDRRATARISPDRRDRRRVGEEETAPQLLEAALASDLPVAQPEGNREQAYQVLKRAFDIVGAVGLVVLLSPVLVTTFAILLVTTKGKPLFIQQRIGYLALSAEDEHR